MSTKKKLIRCLTILIAFAYAVLTGFITILCFNQELEVRYMPVLADPNATIVINTTERIDAVVSADKLRMCTLLGMTAEVQRNNEWVSAKAQYKDPYIKRFEEDQHGRPLGTRLYEMLSISPGGDKVRLTLHHKCHRFWNTVTVFYTSDLSQSPVKIYKTQ